MSCVIRSVSPISHSLVETTFGVYFFIKSTSGCLNLNGISSFVRSFEYSSDWKLGWSKPGGSKPSSSIPSSTGSGVNENRLTGSESLVWTSFNLSLVFGFWEWSSSLAIKWSVTSFNISVCSLELSKMSTESLSVTVVLVPKLLIW